MLRLTKALYLVAALIATTPAISQPARDVLLTSVAVEWVTANCPNETVDPFVEMFTTIIILSTHPDRLAEMRDFMRDAVKENFGADTESLCVSLSKILDSAPDFF